MNRLAPSDDHEVAAENDAIYAELARSPAELASFREEVTTLAGTVVRFDTHQVQISADVKVSFRRLYGSIPATCGFGIKRFIKHLTTRNAPEYVRNTVGWLAPLARPGASGVLRASLERNGHIGYDVFTAFEAEVARTVTRSRIGHYSSAFTRWYEFCVRVGMPGFDEDVAADLSDLVFPDPIKGRAVLSEDPDEGPIPKIEFEGLLARLNAATDILLASTSGEVDGLDLEEIAFTWLLVCYGTNPKNLRYLDEGDIRMVPQPGGVPLHEIKIPRIKKRLKGERIEFRTRELPADIYKLLDRLRKRNRKDAPQRDDRPGCARPLFRRKQPNPDLIGTKFEKDVWRQNSAWPRSVVGRIADLLAIPKVGGGIVSLHPRRFRYTFATRLVANGLSSAMVADALDHSDTSHVLVYFNMRGEVVRRLDKALALSLAPVAQAFMGVAINDESEAARGGDPTSRIHHHSKTMEQLDTVGNCGKYGFCNLYAPVACYTCRFFQPLLGAPHVRVLEELDTLRSQRHAAGLPPKIVQIHDLTMLAVGQVILACEDRNNSREAGDAT